MKPTLNHYEEILSLETSVKPNSVSDIRQQETAKVPSASISKRRSGNPGVAPDSKHGLDVRSGSAYLWPHASIRRIAFAGGAAGGGDRIAFRRGADYVSCKKKPAWFWKG